LTPLENKTQHLGHPASSLISVPTGLLQVLDGRKYVENAEQPASSFVPNSLVTEVNKTH